MGYRLGAGHRAMGAGLGRLIVGVLAVAVVAAGPSVGIRAASRLHPLDHHAVVLNGGVVGSAFAITDGIAVTNRHVVAGLLPGAAVVVIASRDSRTRVEGRVIAISPRMDLALLRVPSSLLPKVGAEDAPATTGLAVEAAGIDAGEGGDGELLEADGVVIDPSETIPAFGPGLIVRMPGARPGFSGGPLLDTDGRLVGMVTAIRPADGTAAVPMSGMRARRYRSTVEAFALRAAEIRAEVRRLLGSAGT